ncbi:helix-turn-helix domain-containing protein [Streptomyces ochraceiscleroticus]|uniref:Helix-turn-helix domain-containing protein n=1 Tax=Streptomyces ochraceiscleroticus TaxID=47761 RepID=A0ABW1MK00_9ACTN|nr:helix-turn-helix transcriptional regulator [Streptomyces ochraceiscleroticus]
MVDAQSEAKRLGEVIRRARVLKKRSQADVAKALGYHQSKVSRLEGGRGTEDTRLLREVAQVLGIPLDSLGLAASPDVSTADPEAEDMYRRTFLAASITALATSDVPAPVAHDDLVRSLLPGPGKAAARPALKFAELRERVAAVRRLFYHCSYKELEGALPGVIADLRAATGSNSAELSQLSGLLATAYQTAAGLLLKQSDHGNAWLAVGRAMAEAERSEDPVVLASSVRVHAHVLVREKHAAQAVAIVRHTADQLSGSYDRRSPRYLAAFGLMLLRGVTAASSSGDRAATREMLDEAREVARYVSHDRPDAWANFSPTNVELHTVSASVSLGDAGQALEAARPLMRRHIPVPERRAGLWVDVARAYSQQGKLADAFQALRIAERCASQDIRRPAVREMVADMAARDRHRALPELHLFSRRLGAPA